MACRLEIRKNQYLVGKTLNLPSYFSIDVPGLGQGWGGLKQKLRFRILPDMSRPYKLVEGEKLTNMFLGTRKYKSGYHVYTFLANLWDMYKEETSGLGQQVQPYFIWLNPVPGATYPFEDNPTDDCLYYEITEEGVLEGYMIPLVIEWLRGYRGMTWYFTERMKMASSLDNLYEDDPSD